MKYKNPLSAEELKMQVAAIDAIPNEDIDFSDIPQLNDDFFTNAVRGKFYRPIKESTTIRLDADVKAWLKAKGRGYQTKLNDLLRKAMLEEMKHPR